MLKIEKGGKKGANFPRTVYLPFLFSSYLIAVLYALNSNKVSNDGKWINLDNTSIFEYFKPDGKIIIACIYNASEYPSSFTSEDKWCMVLKANERIVLLTVAGVFIAKASNGVWSKKWTRL